LQIVRKLLAIAVLLVLAGAGCGSYAASAERYAVGKAFIRAMLVSHDRTAALELADPGVADGIGQDIRDYTVTGMRPVGRVVWGKSCGCARVRVRTCPIHNGPFSSGDGPDVLNVWFGTMEVDVSSTSPVRVVLYARTGGGESVGPGGGPDFPRFVKARARCIASGRLPAAGSGGSASVAKPA
jgi:hypothetical protein